MMGISPKSVVRNPWSVACDQISDYGLRITDYASITSLIVLRITFGLLMLASTVRFVAKGWVQEFYVDPAFHFTYWGFGWIWPLPAPILYATYAIIGIAALFIALGFFYRVSAVTFFLLFSYTELLDKTYYLNHYYFISLLSFLIIFLPLHRTFSLDSWRNPSLRVTHVPAWMVWAVRLQLGLVYFFAGVAKLTPDWLFRAQPLRIWLAANIDFPLIGPLFDYVWFAFVMSWAGALFDLTIPFWLSWRRTRPYAYIVVIGFHVMTGLLFNIGMFPWIMIASTLVFFDQTDWQKLTKKFTIHYSTDGNGTWKTRKNPEKKLVLAFLLLFFAVQILMPFRHLLYPGNVHWTEEGVRFSWRVMLVEKTGSATFYVTDAENGRFYTIHPIRYLTATQEKQMSFQPDMILQFAHYLADVFAQQGVNDPIVQAEVYVSWNGRSSRQLIDPTVNLAAQPYNLHPRLWILSEH